MTDPYYGAPYQQPTPGQPPGPYPPGPYPPAANPTSAPPQDPYNLPQPYGQPQQPTSASPYPTSGHPAAAGGYYQPQQQYGAPAPPYGASPAAPYGLDPLTGLPLSDKSKVVAGLLQLLVGGFAVGRFYTGHMGMAVGQLAVGWGVLVLMICPGFLLVLPPFFCWVGFMWPVVDGIILLAKGGTDAQGRVLRS